MGRPAAAALSSWAAFGFDSRAAGAKAEAAASAPVPTVDLRKQRRSIIKVLLRLGWARRRDDTRPRVLSPSRIHALVFPGGPRAGPNRAPEADSPSSGSSQASIPGGRTEKGIPWKKMFDFADERFTFVAAEERGSGCASVVSASGLRPDVKTLEKVAQGL